MRKLLARGFALGLVLAGGPAAAATLEVPSQYASIQAAVDAASDGDTVRIAPAVYVENLVLAGKSVVLSSHFQVGGDPDLIDQTILDGGGGPYAIWVTASAGPQTRIVGLTLRNADDGITADAPFEILHSRITGTSDGIDYEDGSGGAVRSCTFEGNGDDGIDLDNDVALIVEDSIIRDNLDDGIEIRMQPYTGPDLEIVIRRNLIAGNDDDGIQLIDYGTLSSRVFRIERNLFVGNRLAGIGMMCCQLTDEDFQGASIPERVFLYHNTFVGNDHGVTGGDDLIALNNLFVGSAQIALKRVDGGSVAAYNLFFGNGIDHSESNVDLGSSLFADPQLDASQRPAPTSPAIDAGTAFYEHAGEVVLDVESDAYEGPAPDLGAFETPAPVGLPALSRRGAALLGLATLLAAARLLGAPARQPPAR